MNIVDNHPPLYKPKSNIKPYLVYPKGSSKTHQQYVDRHLDYRQAAIENQLEKEAADGLLDEAHVENPELSRKTLIYQRDHKHHLHKNLDAVVQDLTSDVNESPYITQCSGKFDYKLKHVNK